MKSSILHFLKALVTLFSFGAQLVPVPPAGFFLYSPGHTAFYFGWFWRNLVASRRAWTGWEGRRQVIQATVAGGEVCSIWPMQMRKTGTSGTKESLFASDSYMLNVPWSRITYQVELGHSLAAALSGHERFYFFNRLHPACVQLAAQLASATHSKAGTFAFLAGWQQITDMLLAVRGQNRSTTVL